MMNRLAAVRGGDQTSRFLTKTLSTFRGSRLRRNPPKKSTSRGSSQSGHSERKITDHLDFLTFCPILAPNRTTSDVTDLPCKPDGLKHAIAAATASNAQSHTRISLDSSLDKVFLTRPPWQTTQRYSRDRRRWSSYTITPTFAAYEVWCHSEYRRWKSTNKAQRRADLLVVSAGLCMGDSNRPHSTDQASTATSVWMSTFLWICISRQGSACLREGAVKADRLPEAAICHKAGRKKSNTHALALPGSVCWMG